MVLVDSIAIGVELVYTDYISPQRITRRYVQTGEY